MNVKLKKHLPCSKGTVELEIFPPFKVAATWSIFCTSSKVIDFGSSASKQHQKQNQSTFL